jgi:hypothetical protein
MRVPALVVPVEAMACCLVSSAIAWLRYLYGAPMSRDWHATAVRYLIPVLMPILVGLLIYMGVTHRAESYVPAVSAAGLGIAVAVLVVWLVVEVGRYSARHRSVSHDNRPYSHISSPQRRAERGRGRNRTW